MRKILISESEKQRILNQHSLQGYKTLSNLISEADRRKDIKKFGFDDEISNIFHSIDDKRSLWLANITARSFAKMKNIEGKNLKDIVKKIKPEEFKEYIEEKQGDYHYIMDWVKSPRRDDIDFKEIQTIEQAMEGSRLWHESLTGDYEIGDESGVIIKKFPDGYYWKDLQTNCSEEEGKMMQHCGTDRQATTLFSFRDYNKKPHITIGYNENDKTITQVKGKQNRRPEEQYIDFAIDFIRNMINKGDVKGFKWSYMAGGNPDFTLDEIGELFGNQIKKNTILLQGLGRMSAEDILSFMKDDDTNADEITSIILNLSENKFLPEMLSVAEQKLDVNNFDLLLKGLVNKKITKGTDSGELNINLTDNIVKSIFEKTSSKFVFDLFENKYDTLNINGDNTFTIDVPESIVKLQNLLFLNCKLSIKSLPNNINQMSNLQYISIVNNIHFKQIPENLCKLESLQFLSLIGTNVELPECLKELYNNEQIYIQTKSNA